MINSRCVRLVEARLADERLVEARLIAPLLIAHPNIVPASKSE